jgi:hypothetical protein
MLAAAVLRPGVDRMLHALDASNVLCGAGPANGLPGKAFQWTAGCYGQGLRAAPLLCVLAVLGLLCHGAATCWAVCCSSLGIADMQTHTASTK